jgi:hypothetical protein
MHKMKETRENENESRILKEITREKRSELEELRKVSKKTKRETSDHS